MIHLGEGGMRANLTSCVLCCVLLCNTLSCCTVLCYMQCVCTLLYKVCVVCVVLCEWNVVILFVLLYCMFWDTLKTRCYISRGFLKIKTFYFVKMYKSPLQVVLIHYGSLSYFVVLNVTIYTAHNKLGNTKLAHVRLTVYIKARA